MRDMSEGAREQLRHLTKTDADPRVRRRAQAVLLASEGHPLAEVARLFHTAAQRVRVWRERFAQEGRDGLHDRPRGGRPPKLGAAERAFLETALEQGPQAYGLPVTVWSIRDLQALLRRERGVEVSVDTVHRAVHELGYRYRRPRHDLTHRQDAEAVASAKRVLEWLPKKALLSLDDPIWSTWTNARSIPTPYLAQVWRRKGQPMKIPAAGEDQQFTVFGAVDYATGQIIWHTSARKGEDAFAAFLEHLAQQLPAADEPVVVVLDTVGSQKSRALRDCWQRYADRFQPFFLPAYAPQLNLIERLWRSLKAKLANHRWWNDRDRLQQATDTLLRQLTVHFHCAEGPAFLLVQDLCESA